MRIRILSEGALDHGDTFDSKQAAERASRRTIDGQPDRKGAVTILVRRLLEEKLRIRCMSPVLPLPAGWAQIRGHDGDENDGNELGEAGRGVARER